MRIEEIDSFLVHHWYLVRVRTDNGVTGWGETAFWGYPDASERIVQYFRKYLLGQDPLRIEHHWQYMYRYAPFRGGALMGALSAIDIALWDVAGKALGVPTYQLLGGKVRDKVRLYLIIGGNTVDELVKEAVKAVKEGYTAVKFDPLPPNFHRVPYPRLFQEVVDRVRSVREAVGLDVDIVAEIHRKLGPGEAIALAQELVPYRLYFYEDPIIHDSVDSMAEVARKVTIPMATGERLHTIYEFRELLEKRASQFVRPDVGLSGGLTHCKKIAALAESYHAQVVCHNFLSPLLTAATLQLGACVPNIPIQEHVREDQPPRSELLKSPNRIEKGYMIVPDAPGLGVEVNEEVLDKYPFTPMGGHVPIREDGSVYGR